MGGDVMRKVGVFFAGGAVGAFLGLLVGMSASPVVASVVSGLVGFVTAFATAMLGGGLHEAVKRSAEAHRPAAIEAHVYLAGFSLFGIAAVLVGLHMRTHNTLSPTPKEVVDRWVNAGLLPAQAQQVALDTFQTGFALDVLAETAPEKKEERKEAAEQSPVTEPREPGQPGKPAPRYGSTVPASSTVLIAADTTKCDEILGHINRGESELADTSFQQAGGDWAKRWAQLRGLPDDARHQLMATFARNSCNQKGAK